MAYRMALRQPYTMPRKVLLHLAWYVMHNHITSCSWLGEAFLFWLRNRCLSWNASFLSNFPYFKTCVKMFSKEGKAEKWGKKCRLFSQQCRGTAWPPDALKRAVSFCLCCCFFCVLTNFQSLASSSSLVCYEFCSNALGFQSWWWSDLFERPTLILSLKTYP